MSPITDHSLRYALANELHARPFPSLSAPCFAAYLAVKRPENAVGRDRGADRAHLLALLDRFGAAHPQPDATHYFGQIGRYHLKWEQHTEFVTYTVFGDGNMARPFDPVAFDVFPEDWLVEAPGVRITSALIRVEEMSSDDEMRSRLADWFVPESLAATRVLDRNAVVAGDFRIDEAGHLRFAVFTDAAISARRVGRIVQRVCEIETYKTMSMLGLARARALQGRLGQIDVELSRLVSAMGQHDAPETVLEELLSLSAELEDLMAKSSFRFGATGAYEAIVHQRIEVLREERFGGRQTFTEFMMRRFDPAMRTVKSAERQLATMAERAMRAGDLLRTRVDVERSAQNQALLESMDRRADLQLRLQETVEGLSVVAISYYAVSLASYLFYPVTEYTGLSKGKLTAALVIPVVGLVWLGVRRIKHHIEK
ncbi:DUF3422 domain-containing protein [Aliiroseovarius subalbicans]|uniref:DUF3422 family protein n=1 Tax=Aliiroseovarius subalbicans TaxID=2925840 RepID=UPI001F597E4C|nr:DUF3422 domain-containing protein [Aliiroseovarius subalbicans]MCI2397991.1 DUF3422 domain-containing protein [Aliiroseovarius subalbicans]